MTRAQARMRLLEDHLHPAAEPTQLGPARPPEVSSVEEDCARSRPLQADDRPAERGLARARFADETDDLAARDVEVDVVYGVHGPGFVPQHLRDKPALVEEVHAHPAELDERLGAHRRPARAVRDGGELA